MLTTIPNADPGLPCANSRQDTVSPRSGSVANNTGPTNVPSFEFSDKVKLRSVAQSVKVGGSFCSATVIVYVAEASPPAPSDTRTVTVKLVGAGVEQD